MSSSNSADMKQNLAGNGSDGESVPPPPPVSRALLVAVILMGVLLVVGTIALVWVVIGRMMHPAPHTQAQQAALQAPVAASAFGQNAFSRLAVPLHAGENVQSVTPRSDGSLAVLVVGPQGGRVMIWQPETARLLAEFDLLVPAAISTGTVPVPSTSTP